METHKDRRMGTHVFNNKEYNIYKDSKVGLEFIFVDREEKRFWELLKKFKDPLNIPENILMTGIYFRIGTRDTNPNYKNGHIHAKYITK
jgi:hypothetical protein